MINLNVSSVTCVSHIAIHGARPHLYRIRCGHLKFRVKSLSLSLVVDPFVSFPQGLYSGNPSVFGPGLERGQKMSHPPGKKNKSIMHDGGEHERKKLGILLGYKPQVICLSNLARLVRCRRLIDSDQRNSVPASNFCWCACVHISRRWWLKKIGASHSWDSDLGRSLDQNLVAPLALVTRRMWCR